MPKLAHQTRTARRNQIIAAAVGCFARSGYHSTTMADVAVAAGVSKGTPYLYFPSKEALFIALHDEWGCGLTERVDAAVGALTAPAHESPRTVLRTVAAAVGAHVVGQPESCRVLMEARTLAAYHPAIAAAVQTADRRTQEKVEGLIRAGVAAGQWPQNTDPALQARLFTAALYGLMAHWHLAPDSFSWDAAAHSLAEVPQTER
ncbi:TetR/AcrR family transcriptional regulator [Streptomyces sediminimaris]|uniref:TetR/AcrR family transcriptional regulator n=1 Tax=Streptomyces sediminimaris TaxID=3383721 RepID=UPI00399AFF87